MPGMYSFIAPSPIFDFELVALAWLVGLDDEINGRELTFRAENLLVSVFDFDALSHALAKRHLQRADIGFDLVGAPEDVELSVEMEFAHALENGHAGLLIGRHAERWIFRSKLRQCDVEHFPVGLRLRLDRDFYQPRWLRVDVIRHRSVSNLRSFDALTDRPIISPSDHEE